jgi:hypothetical protein
MKDFLHEVRKNEKNRNLYTNALKRADYSKKDRSEYVEDISQTINRNDLSEIEEKLILKRWQSPSIMEAL